MLLRAASLDRILHDMGTAKFLMKARIEGAIG